ncbi:MAG: site-specific integrase [Rhodocyclaceae bacterium]|nr:site-specific integrase [Rhodocyclaceae bacterium]MBX3678428.1 site-specific integrase [Rhodocyclaceae bacterium]MCO5098952.1 site-specific integrase [Rhodocyclaceae bacterium]
MSLYKRKDSPYWWVKISLEDREPVQRSTGTSDRRKAHEFHDKLKAQLWDEQRLGVKPCHSWKEAVVRWVSESKHKANHWQDLVYLKWLDQYLGDKLLPDINRVLIDRIIAARLAGGVSNASVNRTMQVVRVILRRAVTDWEWLDKTPKFRWLPEPTRRIRWLTREEAQRLIAVLPVHLAAMTRFSLETGLRRANVTGLRWSQVDLVRKCAWIHADQAKARKPIPVPLSAAAIEVVREQIGKNLEFVFTYLGKPVKQVNTKAWGKALKAAGIEDFRWHDLRHTWASWHVQAGTPLYALQELGGWESPEMVQRYAHLSSEHLAGYVERVSELKLVGGSAVATK